MRARSTISTLSLACFLTACGGSTNSQPLQSVGTATTSVLSAAPTASVPIGPVAPTGLDTVSSDDLFIAGLQSGGVEYTDPETMKTLGQGICSELSAGNPLIAEVDAVTTGSKGKWNTDSAGAIVGTAIGAYCPQFKSLLPN